MKLCVWNVHRFHIIDLYRAGLGYTEICDRMIHAHGHDPDSVYRTVDEVMAHCDSRGWLNTC